VDGLLKTVTTKDGASLTLEGIRNFPTPEQEINFDLISLIGPLLYVYVFQLMFPVILGSMVYEKEHSLREVMKMMGLKQTIYWIVTYMFSFLLYMVATALLVLLASALGFRYFLVNELAVTYIFFFLWGNVLVAFSLMLSVFFTKTRSSTVVGYVYVFAVGIIAQNLVGPYFNEPRTPASTLFVVQLVPQFVFYRGLTILSNGVTFGGTGVTMAGVFSGENAMGEVYLFMIAQWAVLMVLAVYLENIVPSPIGVKKSPLYPLHALMRLCKGKKDAKVVDKNGTDEAMAPKPVEGEYPDVKAERERVYADTEAPLRIYNLKKTYKGLNGGADVEAVKNLTIGVNEGQCFGFLGPNGAGKSTTMNMLCGYFGPTEGTAKVFGYDVRTDMSSIHMLLGVCPQENVLWEDLTGREHLNFYGRLKGMTGETLTKAVNYRLGQVDLLTAGDKASGAYSGGMKRRLCVAIALVGNPRVVILDEPSTGLDPKARRDLWQVIRQATKTAAVLLTTHSMEEAETLCSRIGIFIKGRLRCLGTASDLKQRLGDGYYVHVMTKKEGNENAVEDYLKKSIPGLELLNSLNGTRNYQVGAKDSSLAGILKTLMVGNDDGSKEVMEQIEDWGVENTTLEQVFVEITKNDGKGSEEV
jgi:ABC-type multidrug transport system ATPase subunit